MRLDLFPLEEEDDRGLLDRFQEECAEAVQAASKVKRFGPGLHPAAPIGTKLNALALASEIADVELIIAELRRRGIAAAPQPAPERQDSRDEAVAAKDEAYHERNLVVAALAKLFPSGIGKTDIPGWEPEWHGCVYIDLPTGQVSWHYHDREAELFAGLPPYTKPWDGHNTPEKYRRLAALAPAGPGLRELLREVVEHGLIYWEPQTARGVAAKASMIARCEAALAQPEVAGERLPRLTDAMIRGACMEHYKTDAIDSVTMTFDGVDYTFREAFKRMWAGVQKAAPRSRARQRGERVMVDPEKLVEHADRLSACLEKPGWRPSRAHIEEARNALRQATEALRIFVPPPSEPGSKPGTIKARFDIEAQYGINDIWPGDDYPAPGSEGSEP